MSKIMEQAEAENEKWNRILTTHKENYAALEQKALIVREEFLQCQQDADRYQWLTTYLIGSRTDLDDAIVSCVSVEELNAVIDGAMKENYDQMAQRPTA